MNNIVGFEKERRIHDYINISQNMDYLTGHLRAKWESTLKLRFTQLLHLFYYMVVRYGLWL